MCAVFSVIYEAFSHEVYSPWLPVFLAAGGLLALSTVLAMRLRRRKEYGRG